MASVSKDPDGKKRIGFTNSHGVRKHIRLGKLSVRKAESIKVHVENLLSAQIQGCEPNRFDAEWLISISPVLRQKLVNVGLCKPLDSDNNPTVKNWVEDYIASRTDLKPGTIKNLNNAARNLFDFCGCKKLVKEFTPHDAENFRTFLLNQNLSVPTAHRRAKRVKQFFLAAIKKRIITENPFLDVSTANRTNKARQRFIEREDICKVIDACPNAQWRLIFALSRYGGIRIPSELFPLTWDDILWDRNLFIVHSPKTEHIENRESRSVPLFPELLPHFLEVLEQAKPNEKRIVTIYDKTNKNLRTQAHRIIKRAGLEPWPKPFQNLRSSRETELVESFPIHVVTEWIGNSPDVAKKHYLQMTEEHFRRAAQNTAQNMHETIRKELQDKLEMRKKNAVSSENCETLRNLSKSCNLQNLQLIPPTGFEPVSRA